MVGQAREREPQPMTGRERAVAGGIAVLFLAAAAGLHALLPADRPAQYLLIASLVVMYAVATRVHFEIGNGIAAPSQLLFIPLLFLAPLSAVPLLVAAGHLLARAPEFFLRRVHADRWLHAFGDAWFAIGPVVVIGLLAPGAPAIEHVDVYALAFGAQLGTGLLLGAVGDRLLYGTSIADGLRMAGWAYRIDAVLTPIAFMATAVAATEPLLLFAMGPLVWLLHTFSAERKERYAAALELNQTYRGTVMVLSDVVEADDTYTADHCRSVVELAAAVADELGFDPADRQELEMVALLHDVGKIAIPNEILNKPARLTDEEFELMKTHTLEGQALLARVGGRLARVGEMVRSCHERWDGRGYPDGLKGEEIPFAARIVFCCDAYSAMTTDRPYRRAMSHERAIQELRDNAGTQFEPQVVEALCRVVHEGIEHHASEYSDAVRAVLAGHSLAQPTAELTA